MTKKLLRIALLASLSVGFIACSNDKDDEEKGSGETTETVALLTKVQISYVPYSGDKTNSSTTTFSYNSNNQPVSSSLQQTSGDDTYTGASKMYYTNGKLSGFSASFTSNGSFIGKDSSRIETNEQGRVAKVTFYNEDSDFKTAESILTYKWDNDKVIEVANLTKARAYPLAYTNGNVTLVETAANNTTYTATFDDKKNPYALLLDISLASNQTMDSFVSIVEDDQIISAFCNNNITKSTFSNKYATRETSYTYEYDADGYVTKSIENGVTGVTTTIFTYEKRTVTVKK